MNDTYMYWNHGSVKISDNLHRSEGWVDNTWPEPEPLGLRPAPETCTIAVYLDNGVVYEYEVDSHDKVREHADAIVKTGYRHTKAGEMTHYPPHRIMKVKCTGPGINTSYPDQVRGT